MISDDIMSEHPVTAGDRLGWIDALNELG